MAVVSSSVDVVASAERVFAYMSDPRNQPEWTPNLIAITDGPHGALGDGMTYRAKLRGFGDLPFRIADFEAGRRFAVVTGPSAIPMTHTFTVIATSGGASRVDHEVVYTPRRIARAAGPILKLVMKRMIADLDAQLFRTLNTLN